MKYNELNGIDFVFYFNKYYNKIYLTDLRNRTSVCDDGTPWFEGAYGNCLIVLKYHTDKLYLVSKDRIQDIYDAGFYNVSSKQRIEILEKYANKIVERGTERHSHIVIEKD